MEFNAISLETKEPENEENNEIKEENKNKINMTENKIKEKISYSKKSKDYILSLQNENDKKYILNIYHDNNYFYFKLKKQESIDISLFYFLNKYDFSTLIDKLKLDYNIFMDFNSIEKILIECLDENKAYIKSVKNNSINVSFKLMDLEKDITLLKTEMNEDEKFDKILEDIKELKNSNLDKIEELKKLSKEIEDEAEKKCKENKDILDSLELQVEQNKNDIDKETEEIESLKEEIQKIKEEMKDNEDKIKNKKDCLIF